MKVSLAQILKEQKFINDFQVIEDDKQNTLKIILRYNKGVSAISGLRRESSPGLRLYSNKDKLPRVLNGLGIAIISTSKGLMTDKQARLQSTGGEVLCTIW